ncbi:sugar ABC transporter ATP-binding protein [Halanaerobium hydrogeniformans]|uniref:ABC transporter related protein n=1 Tax=Halanaerobium hydrogeniformans TaxID=656519 RepID=E4RNW0_HALHG|nr:sugar ABC transporter ATP-binding protein [Halanaerobium hydrogeniformans]ADQ13650.1 ABC transporter related protein [Halanaerobium hydrogeniformans]
MATVLQMKNISKFFPGVKALDNVDFSLESGEIHVLAGENGAGKSTLIKILSGAYTKSEGEIFLHGEKVDINNPIKAKKLGINVIYQELELALNMTVMENIFLGKLPLSNRALGTVNFNKIYKETQKILDKLGLEFSPNAIVGDLRVADQQMVEIAKALLGNPEILIMDEPTSSLCDSEIERLFTVMEDLRKSGKSIVFISHRMKELWEVGDRISILRSGKMIITESLAKIDENGVTSAMVGKEIENKFPKQKVSMGDEVLRVEALSSKNGIKNISFNVKAGEILGISGLVGSGRTEILRAIFGADKTEEGEIYVKGKKVNIKNPNDAVKYGIGLIPEDRKQQGLVLDLNVKDNITLSILKKLANTGVLDQKKMKEVSKEYIEKLSIKTPNMNFKSKLLSGGNQQKVVLAKWLCAKSNVFLFDEPTRGIDVGAKVEVYELMIELAKNGAAIIMVSSEMPEILNMSDRILVMHEGKITGKFRAEDAKAENILNCAMGGELSDNE